MKCGSIIKATCPSCRRIFQIILPKKVKRTQQQNKWYWACVVGIPADHFGYLPDEMHAAYKMMFLRVLGGRGPETIKSTTTLNTQEFSEYVEKCRMWAANEGIVIPDPDDVFPIK